MRIFIVTLLFVLTAAPIWATPARPVPSPSPSPSPSRPSAQVRDGDPRVAIPAVMSMQEKAWNRGDLQAFMSGYLRADDITYTAGGVVVRGWQTLTDRYQARYGNDRSTMGTLRFENLVITPLGDAHALCVGQWFLQPPDPSSARPASAPPATLSDAPARPRPMDGVFSLVWTRTKDGWKIIHDHSSARAVKG